METYRTHYTQSLIATIVCFRIRHRYLRQHDYRHLLSVML